MSVVDGATHAQKDGMESDEEGYYLKHCANIFVLFFELLLKIQSMMPHNLDDQRREK